MRFYINECCMNRIYEGVYILLEGVAQCFAKSVHYMPKMTSRFSDAFEINLYYNFSAFLLHITKLFLIKVFLHLYYLLHDISNVRDPF